MPAGVPFPLQCVFSDNLTATVFITVPLLYSNASFFTLAVLSMTAPTFTDSVDSISAHCLEVFPLAFRELTLKVLVTTVDALEDFETG